MEVIQYEGNTICMIVRASTVPERTVFFTPDNLDMQVGKVVRAADDEIARHRHKPKARVTTGFAEVLVVQQGRMILDLYADGHTLHSNLEVGLGDIVILMAGGHGFRFLEETVLLEVKQGPYFGPEEKEFF